MGQHRLLFCYYKLSRSTPTFPFFLLLCSLSLLSWIAMRIILGETSKCKEDNNNKRSITLTLPNTRNDIWTRISDSLHVYSAFLDARYHLQTSLMIRIIAVKRFKALMQIAAKDPLRVVKIKEETSFYKDEQSYLCKLLVLSSNNDNPLIYLTSNVTYHVFEEGIKSFAGTFINCYFSISATFPTGELYVALVPTNVEGYPDKLLKVHLSKLPQMSRRKNNTSISVCVRPLFSPTYDESMLNSLVQFISYYKAMGVKQFNFYELHFSPRVRKYLTDLSSEGGLSDVSVVQLQMWNVPTGNPSELWDYGGLAALNDCLYGNMGYFSHVILVDLDEFIVPQKEGIRNLPQLIDYLESQGTGIPAHILIRSTFFCKEFCNTTNPSPFNLEQGNAKVQNGFEIASCTTRTMRGFSVKMRTKFIVRPERIVSVGHHTSHNFWRDPRQRPNAHSAIVAGTKIALLNHYRECALLPRHSRRGIVGMQMTQDLTMQRILMSKNFSWIMPMLQ